MDPRSSRAWRAPTTGTDITSSLTQKLDWFGTARARAGFLATPTLLLYGTGGFAYGEVKTSGSVTGTGLAGTPLTVAFPGTSSTRSGWTAGGGIEGRIVSNWTWKLEYLYMDLGRVSDGPIVATWNSGAGPQHWRSLLFVALHRQHCALRRELSLQRPGPMVAKY